MQGWCQSEAIPTTDITATSVAQAFVSGWVASSISMEGSYMLLHSTQDHSIYHLAAISFVEHFHRPLQTSLTKNSLTTLTHLELFVLMIGNVSTL